MFNHYNNHSGIYINTIYTHWYPWSLYIYIYTHTYIYIYIYIYMHTFTHPHPSWRKPRDFKQPTPRGSSARPATTLRRWKRGQLMGWRGERIFHGFSFWFSETFLGRKTSEMVSTMLQKTHKAICSSSNLHFPTLMNSNRIVRRTLPLHFPSLGFVKIHPCKKYWDSTSFIHFRPITRWTKYIFHWSCFVGNPETCTSPKRWSGPREWRKWKCILFDRSYCIVFAYLYIMCIYTVHIYIYMFVYYLESSFAKSDVIFFLHANVLFLCLPRELHLRWKLERLELRMGKSGVEFLASMN